MIYSHPIASDLPRGSKTASDQAKRLCAPPCCWTGQIFKHFPDPKPAYVADWDELPQWQQETDADIFERIEQESQAPRDHQQPHP